MTKSKAAAKPTKQAKAVYSDGHPQDVIQYLEAKLILKPEPFTSVESFREFGRIVEKTTKQFEKIEFIPDAEMSLPQLVHLYSVGQMAPGPNMMMIVAIGEWAAGLLGAIVAVVAFFGPTGLLTFMVGRLWNKLSNWPWRKSIQEGLALCRSACC
jgi:Chromate transporter